MKNLVILVVEDEPIQRLVLVEDLEDLGFTVYQAGDAAEALQKIETFADIQLVFTDMRMPGSMDGIGLLHRVYNQWPYLLLMATSGHLRPPKGSLPDDTRFVSKPFTVSSFLAEMESLAADKGM